ncbi:hypothetical protein V2S84_27825, partial [Azotobacter chroococcum]|nr:hypothetical protein [Azotobacter chroococcum]
AGIEYYLPLFFEETATLLDYLPPATQVFSLPGIEQAAESFWSDVRNRYEERRLDPERPLLPPAELFLPVEDCFARLKDLASGITPAGIEYYLPLFFEETATLLDYLPPATQVFSLPGIEQAAESFW